MKITVKLFALAADVAGTKSIDLDLPDGATVGDVRSAMHERMPTLGELTSRMMMAVNQDYAADDRVLAAGDEVACIPPVSGG